MNDAPFYSDADIEMVELADLADEDADETCLACLESYQSITWFESRDDRTHVYECVCGHRSVWIGHQRLS